MTEAEMKALYDLIEQLSGGNAENVFAWDGSDDASDPTTSACVKLFKAKGVRLPDNLKD